MAALAALDAGAEAIIVCDNHHGGDNIDLTQMPSDPRITCLPRSVGYQGSERWWMPWLDTVDALMLIGHHANAGTPGAFLPHTWMLEWDDF